MKKIILTLSLIFTFILSFNAQEIGLRYGDVTASDLAIDLVLDMGESTRIHSDISFGSGVGIDLLWDFIYKPLSGESLHWYMGAGPYTLIGSEFKLGAVGELGLEYRFNEFPLVIGADWRPFFRIVDSTSLGLDTFGVNVRWRF